MIAIVERSRNPTGYLPDGALLDKMFVMALSRLVISTGITLLFACGSKPKQGEPDAELPAADACNDLFCAVVDCTAKGLPPTTVTGTVFAPNGTLPLFGVNVYVPSSDPGPLPEGVQCDRCGNLQGGSITSTTTDEAGNFRLENVPATADVPIVIQSGKWRRQFKISTVAACQDNPAAKVDTTLPKNRSEGDIPKIAITTGNADALECLVRKMGIEDTEFGTGTEDTAVHLYRGNGTAAFAASHPGGARNFAPAKPFWDTRASLDTYDIVLLSCEGDQLINGTGNVAGVNDKPQTSLQALHDYAGAGGRVFMSHWHNVWISGDRTNPTNPAYGMADWKAIFNWAFGASQTNAAQITTVDESTVTPPAVIGGLPNPKGTSFATWLMNVGASTTRNEVSVTSPRYTAPSIANPPLAERWVYVDPARSITTVPGSNPAQPQSSVQDALFTTPLDVAPEQRCGKVVFSDMHVASGSTSPANGTFPVQCSTADLTPQEKALAFIFFDISSCVGILQ